MSTNTNLSTSHIQQAAETIQPKPSNQPNMKLRFDIDLASAVFKGVNVPGRTVTVCVDVSALPQQDRYLIASRLYSRSSGSVDVLQTFVIGDEVSLHDREGRLHRVVASEPTLESLLQAVRRDHERLDGQLEIVGRRLERARQAQEHLANLYGQGKPSSQPG